MAAVAGHCLCGAVQVSTTALFDTISACHCEMCRRWSGAVQLGIEAPREAVSISGPVKTYRSSSFAERGWCDVCGSAVFFRNVAGRDADLFEFAPGLFENAGGARLARVVYADCAVGGIEFEGDDIERVTRAEYEAKNDFVPEAAT
jgi:hypothetical protein